MTTAKANTRTSNSISSGTVFGLGRCDACGATGRTDRGELLVDYLGLSETQIVKAAERLAADGKYAMAADLLESAEPKFPGSNSVKRAKRFAYLKLMEKNQNTDPFKFIIYSAKIGEQTPQINAEHAK